MLCNECTKRHLCTSLCPEAETYVNQDHAYLREKTIGLPMYDKVEWPEKPIKSIFTRREKEVLSLLLSGKTREEIIQLLGITKENLKKIIKRMKKKGTKNLLYIEGQSSRNQRE